MTCENFNGGKRLWTSKRLSISLIEILFGIYL